MKHIIIATLILLSNIVIYANGTQGAKISGEIKSAVSNEELPSATITVKNTKQGTISNHKGEYILTELSPGKHTISARFIGYKAQEKEVYIEKGKDIELDFALEEDNLNLETIVVTGTRTEHFIKDVPIRTEVITDKQIENKNAANLYQALEGTSGIRVENQCQSCNFTMVRMQGLGAEHTQVLINGQPMYSGLAGVYGLQQMSASDIGQIEIVKGAGSALYGSSAVAGAINIITKEPSYEPSTNINLQFGNYNTNRYELSSSLRNETGDFGININVQKLTEAAIDETGQGNNYDAVNNQDGVTDRTATDLLNAGFGLFFENMLLGNDKLIIRGKSVFEKRQGGIMDDDYYKNPYTDATENIITDRYEAQLSYDKMIGESSEMNFSTAYVIHKRDATNDSFLSDYMDTHNGSVPDLREMRPYLANENSITSTLTFGTYVGDHSLLAGVQFFHTKLDESGMYVVVDPESEFEGESYRSVSDKSATEFGFFLQDEWEVSSTLTVVPGIRVDNHNSGEEYSTDKQVFATNAFPKTEFTETNINPRIAVKYDISELLSLRANAGTGFRAPYGFSEDLHLCSGSPRVWKSSALEPETSVSYNLSADYYGRMLKFSINMFRTDLKDKIGFTNADADIAAMGYDYQWKNIDDAFVQGFEISMEASLMQTLDLGIDFAYNHGEYSNVREDWIGTEYESDSKYISRFPVTTANIKLEYRPDTWIFKVSGNLQGSMYIDYFNTDIDPEVGDISKIKKTEPFMLFNAGASKSFDSFKLYTGINNIFNYLQDEKYLDDAAFMYAPVYGTMFYFGISIDIKH